MSETGQMGKHKDMSKFEKGQTVMAGQLSLNLQNHSSCGVFLSDQK